MQHQHVTWKSLRVIIDPVKILDSVIKTLTTGEKKVHNQTGNVINWNIRALHLEFSIPSAIRNPSEQPLLSHLWLTNSSVKWKLSSTSAHILSRSRWKLVSLSQMLNATLHVTSKAFFYRFILRPGGPVATDRTSFDKITMISDRGHFRRHQKILMHDSSVHESVLHLAVQNTILRHMYIYIYIYIYI